MLCDSLFGSKSEINALMALMCFHVSRFNARIGTNGELLTLEEQDRRLWNRELIERGSYYFQKAYVDDVSDTMTEYHIQAAMAGLHCQAKDYASTDWIQLLKLYDVQMETNPSPVVELNRLVVLAKAKGVDEAIDKLKRIENQSIFSNYYLFYAIKGDLLAQKGKMDEAIVSILKAIDLTKTFQKRNIYS